MREISKNRYSFQTLAAGIIRGAYRLFFRQAQLMAPVPAGSAGWGLSSSLGTSPPLPVRAPRHSDGVLAKHLQYGWTVWDCVPGQGDTTLDMAQQVGAEGLVVAFSPTKSSFPIINDRASSHGYSNILFLYASVASGERMVSDTLAYKKGLRLSEVLMDEDIPKPEMVRTPMTKSTADLDELIFLCKRVRPYLLLEEISPEFRAVVWQFAESQNYGIFTENGTTPVGSVDAIPFRALLVPAEKKTE